MSWIDHRPDDAAGAFEAMAAAATTGSVDAATFREAMSRLGAAVHVVTTDGPGGKGGQGLTRPVQRERDEGRQCASV